MNGCGACLIIFLCYKSNQTTNDKKPCSAISTGFFIL